MQSRDTGDRGDLSRHGILRFLQAAGGCRFQLVHGPDETIMGKNVIYGF